MGRRSPTDWIDWRLYRRAWLCVVAAVLLVAATSFEPDHPAAPTQAGGVAASDGDSVLSQARALHRAFPHRRPGSSGSLDSAQWMRDRFQAANLTARIVTGTSQLPRSRSRISIANVEAVLPGRTTELVVIYAARDTGSRSGVRSAVGSAALLHQAATLAATQDRRRSYLLVSTDASHSNDAGARLLAERLAPRAARIVAVIGLDRIGDGGELRTPIAPSRGYMPPIGLYEMSRVSAAAAGATNVGSPSLTLQLLRLGVPITRYEHGQLVQRKLPAITLSSARDGRGIASGSDVAEVLRTLSFLLANIDAADAVQSAGKTWLIGGGHVIRGWALKILVASLLLPVWLALARMLVQHRRRWALVASVGSSARAMMAGLWLMSTLWLLAAVGAIPVSSDIPPAAGLMGAIPGPGLIAWALFGITAWVVARGPDWRRHAEPGGAQSTIVVALAVMTQLAVILLAINPYAVIFLVIPLHAWLLLASRHAHALTTRAALYCAGLLGPLSAIVVVSVAVHVPVLKVPTYTLHLIAARGFGAAMEFIVGLCFGLALLVGIAACGSIGAPALRLLRHGTRSPRAARGRGRLDASGGSQRMPRRSPRLTGRSEARAATRERVNSR